MNSKTVRRISKCFVSPKYSLEEHEAPLYLTAWDLPLLSVHYIQNGLLYAKPSPSPLGTSSQREFNILELPDRLKQSLSLALVHFYPLAGRLVTLEQEDAASYVVYVDCKNSEGAGFIHAEVDLTVDDILGPTYVPLIVQSLFDHDRALNSNGHTMPLLTVQVTELVDGVFIGCSMNHCIADGMSYWNFLNSWSEIFQSQRDDDDVSISNPPVLKRWFPDGYDPIIRLPYPPHDHSVKSIEVPEVKERFFHFSSESIAQLKAKANAESNTSKISSFQSLLALVWKCLTRARGLSQDQVSTVVFLANNRSRLNPPLPLNYFGNCIHGLSTSATVADLLERNLGWAALLLYQVVNGHTNEKIRERVVSWMQSPAGHKLDQAFNPSRVVIGSSPRFNKYSCIFGIGKPVSIRSGYGNKSSGRVAFHPGREGGGSMDLEVCLFPDAMRALESDPEFMDLSL